MAENAISLGGLHKTFASGTLDNLLGVERCFGDIDQTPSSTVASKTTGMEVWARLVKNRRGSAITKGLALKWKTSYNGVGVDVAGAGDKVVGFASPYLPSAGVADGDYFWMVYRGPCKAVSDGGTTLADTDTVVSSTAGKIKKQTAAPADTTAAMVQVNSRAGTPMESVTNVDGTVFRILADCLM